MIIGARAEGQGASQTLGILCLTIPLTLHPCPKQYMLRNLSETITKLKSRRLWLGFYLAPTIAAFSIAVVMLPGPRPQGIDSIANSSADVVIGQPDMNSNLINQVGYGKTLNRPGVVVCYGGKLFIADIYNNRVLIYNSIPASDNAVADVVIGQPDMISNSANQGGSAAANTLYSPYGLEVKNGKLIIADSENHRVLIFNSIPTSNNASADVVIGQSDMTSSSINKGLGAAACAPNTLNYPVSVFCDGTRLYVADYHNNRVLLFNSIPASNNASADVVIGQPDMASNTANDPVISAKTLSEPRDIYAYTDTGGTYRLIIADQKNHRVLIYNSVPVSNQPSPEAVIGQNSMDTRTSGCTATKLNTPSFVRVIDGKLFLGDYVNQRILIYNSLPTGVGAAANNVLGQPDMTSKTINNGGISAKSFNYMFDFDSDGTKFLVADGFNNRVLIFNTVPATDFAPSDTVIGQPDFTHNQANQADITSANSMWAPTYAFMAGSKLLVADRYNQRILIYNSLPTSNNAAADVVIGQADMTHNAENQGASCEANTLAYPIGMCSNGTNLIVSDYSNNRILIYNAIPVANNASASTVIGQPDMMSKTANNGGVSARSLSNPAQVWTDGSKLIAADMNNNRVLIYNNIPTTNNAAADVVIGQPDFISNTANNGGVSAKSLWGPSGVYCDGRKLYVSDSANNRVLIFNSIPASNNTAADTVIGQPDMISNSENQGGNTSANSCSSPMELFCDGNILAVADAGNNRLLIYTRIPEGNNVSADIVVGQNSFTSGERNQGGTVSATGQYTTYSAWLDSSRMIVADASNNRVLIYNLNTAKPVISDVKINEAGVVSGDTINSIPTLKAKLSGSGTVGGVYINNLKITLGSTLYTYASFDASTDSYNSTTGIFTFKVKNELVPGKYDLKIEVSDYLGNWATYEATDLEVRAGSEAEIIGVPLNYPNPFNTTAGTTKITYNLTVDSNILVYIFDVRGALVWKRSYLTGSMGGKAGYNEVEWDGKDDFGSTVGNGIYPFRIVAGTKVLGRGKIAVLD